MKFTAVGVCGAYPKVNEGTSCYLFQQKSTTIVVDFGSGAMMNLQKYIDICNIDAIIISHFHADHMCDMFVLMHYLSLNNCKQINVYIPYSKSPFFEIINNCPNFNVTIIHEQIYNILDFNVEFFEVKHIEKTFGMKFSWGSVNVLAYTADTTMCENLPKLIEGSTAVICDCATFVDSEMHINTIDILKLCEKFKCKCLISHIVLEDIKKYNKYICSYNAEILKIGDVYEFI